MYLLFWKECSLEKNVMLEKNLTSDEVEMATGCSSHCVFVSGKVHYPVTKSNTYFQMCWPVIIYQYAIYI